MRKDFGFRRTVCGCDACVHNCKFMPGFLIPADLDRMIPAGANPLAWAEANLLASPGALVQKGTVRFRIQTLVPAVRSNGTCINFNNGLCTIHQIAPFGCAYFDHAMSRAEGDERSHAGLMAVIEAWRTPSLYQTIWSHLHERGFKQHPPDVLRSRMAV